MDITRALVAAVGAFSHTAPRGEPDPNAPEPYAPLDFASGLADEMALALTGLGHELHGDSALHDPDCETLSHALLTARREGRADEGLIIQFLGHGVRDPRLGSLHLVAGDTNPDRIGDSAVEVGALIRSVEANATGPRVLLLLDICHAGQAARIQEALTIPEPARKCWIIGASTDRESAYSGKFTKAAVSVLGKLADGALDIHFSYEFVPVETVAREIHRAITAMDPAGTAHRQTVSLTGLTEIADPEQPFFRNPAYDQAPAMWYRKRSESGLRGFLETLDPGLDAPHFLGRAFAAPRESRSSGRCLFTGRREELRRLSDWLGSPADREPLVVVTGSPGVGKSALLGVIVCLAHPALDGAVDALENRIPRKERPAGRRAGLAAVHARGLSLEQVTASVCRQLDLPEPASGTEADGIDQFVARLADAAQPPVLVIDALDEAAQPALLAEFVLRLTKARKKDEDCADRPVCRLLVGCRPWQVFERLLASAHGTGTLVDLDAVDSERVRQELSDYVAEVLEDPETSSYASRGREVVNATAEVIADRLAEAAEHRGAFLVAGLFAHYLATGGQEFDSPDTLYAAVPTTLAGMLELDLRGLGRGRPWLRATLAALAQTEGAGMPRTLLCATVSAFAPDTLRQDPADADIEECLAAVSFYLRRSVDEDGSTLYRLFHQALADHLVRHPVDPAEPTPEARADAEHVLARLLEGARGNVGSAAHLWQFAPPYLLRHAAAHAARADRFEWLLSDPGFLMYADPASVLPYLDRTGSPDARLYAAVYRTSAEVHRRLGPQDRLRVLALDASRWGAPELAEALWAQADFGLPPHTAVRRARWATGSLLSRSMLGTMSGPDRSLIAVSTVAGEGTDALAVAVDDEGGLWAWNLRTFMLVGQVSPDHGYQITAVTATALADGTTVALTACDDLCVRFWDLRTMRPLGDVVLAHVAPLTSVAVAKLPNGKGVFATGSSDGTAQLWDLESRLPLSAPLRGHRGAVTAVTVLPGSAGPVVATVDQTGTTRLWDSDGSSWELPVEERTTAVTSVVLEDGSPLVITGHSDGTVLLWDADVREASHGPAHGGVGSPIVSIAVVPSATGLALVIVKASGTVSVRDLHGPPEAGGRIFRGHTDAAVQAAAVPNVGKSSCAVTAGRDGTVRCWSLAAASGDRQTQPLSGDLRPVTHVSTAVRQGAPVLISASEDGVVHVRDLRSGRLVQEPLQAGHPDSSNAFALVDLPNKATLGLVVHEHSHVQVWDLYRGTTHGKPLPAPHMRNRHSLHSRESITRLTAVEVPVGGEPLAAGVVDDESIFVWNLQSRQLWRKPLGHHETRVSVLLSSPLAGGGPGLFSGDDRGDIASWDVGSRRLLGEIRAHTGPVLALASVTLSNGRSVLASAGADGQIRLWDTSDGSPLYTVPGSSVPVLALAATGEAGAVPVIAAGGSDRMVRLWGLDETESIPLDSLTLPHAAQTLTFADPHTLCVGFGTDVAVFAVGRRGSPTNQQSRT
ncbi:NACHT and WD repeat domain-containing protein [Streptomyces phaeochromogenes]|nr:NACHT and WD repeat domain-containing protein [Streptomyces phaeochromogenes]